MKILTLVGVALLIWMLYRTVKGNPAAFSKENLNKSFMTLGLLALSLIVLVAFAVMFLKS